MEHTAMYRYDVWYVRDPARVCWTRGMNELGRSWSPKRDRVPVLPLMRWDDLDGSPMQVEFVVSFDRPVDQARVLALADEAMDREVPGCVIET